MDRRNLHQYPDGKWGVRIRLPVHYPNWEYKRKVGSIGEARKLRDEIVVKIARREPLEPPPNHRRTLASLCEEWKMERTHPYSTATADLWAAWAESGRLMVDQVDRIQVQRAIDEMAAKYAAHTVNSRVGILKSIFRLAEDIGAIERSQNPFRKPFRMPKPTPKGEALQPEQICQALIELGEFAPMGEFAALTGLRRNELLYLEWPQVDWERGEICLKKTKNGKPHILPLPSRCLEILRQQQKLGNQYCFPGPGGEAWTSISHNRMWRPAFNRAGLQHFVWHDLRHAMASAAVSAGVELYTVSKLLNHSDTGGMVVTQRYARPNQDAKREALEKVSMYFSRTKTPAEPS